MVQDQISGHCLRRNPTHMTKPPHQIAESTVLMQTAKAKRQRDIESPVRFRPSFKLLFICGKPFYTKYNPTELKLPSKFLLSVRFRDFF